ncbi:MAG: putative GTP-binding protein engB [uncultured bacterium (gcode 4)]|uniref:Probable GTP-binding protein EngB n=1 Tax=uncultured bacterium (gcode 4) TaxID=1234023 RepID=K1XJ68_9BACT|nr:MAG: putative GTP-binding protein engB [uncultured bacterium (gcode 4)]
MLIRSAVFVKSASKLEECPETNLPEFAMIGRSNVGKSSLINTIANHSKLSKVSVTPGKTKLIGYFLMNDEWYLVDLPGYGYAQIGQKNRMHRLGITHDYFIGRENLKKVFVLIDGNILPQSIDLDFIHSLDQKNIPFDIVMTKIDKATQKEFSLHTRLFKEELAKIVTHMPKIFPISNVTKRGKEKLLDYIEELINW